MTTNKNLRFIIYSQKIAGYLMQRGFSLIQVCPNERFPDKNAFLFKNSDALHNAIGSYLTNRDKVGDAID